MRKNARTSEIHGTKREYDLGCRCDECRAANSRAHREYKSRRRRGIARMYTYKNREKAI
jgi:hypothetical protein